MRIAPQKTGSHLIYLILHPMLSNELIRKVLSQCKVHFSSGWANTDVPNTAIGNDWKFRMWNHFLMWSDLWRGKRLSLKLSFISESTGLTEWQATSAESICERMCLHMCDWNVHVCTKESFGGECGYDSFGESTLVLASPVRQLWLGVTRYMICAQYDSAKM